MKVKNKMLKAVFATAILSVSAQNMAHAGTGVDAFDTWEKNRTEQAVYPVTEANKGLRENVVAAYNAPNKTEEISKVLSKIEIGDNQPTHLLLFYAAKHDDHRTIETVLDKTDNNRNLITGLMSNMMNFGKIGNDLRYLKRIAGDKEYDASNLLENAGYVNEKGLATFVMRNFNYSAESLEKATESAMDNHHHGFVQSLLKHGRKMGDADMGLTLRMAASQGETQISREIIKSYTYSDRDLKNALFDAIENHHTETADAMSQSMRKTDKAPIDMTEPFKAALAHKLFTVLPKMHEKFKIDEKIAFDAVIQSVDSGHPKAALSVLQKMTPSQKLPVAALLSIAVDKGEEQVVQAMGRKFDIEPAMIDGAFDIAMARDMTKMRSVLLQVASPDKSKDMSRYMYDLGVKGDTQSAQQIVRKFTVTQDAAVEAMQAARERGHDAFVNSVGNALKHAKNSQKQQKKVPSKTL